MSDDDIVERLRNGPEGNGFSCDFADEGELILEAADEIERLRARFEDPKELWAALGWKDTGSGRAGSDGYRVVSGLWAELREKDAEIERLRAALTEIDEMEHVVVWRCSSDCYREGRHNELCKPIDRVGDVARRALEADHE